jgi:uncharacterized protein YdbL (DUF1318 family)
MRKFASVLVFVLATAGCKDPYGNAAKLYRDVAVTINQASATVDQFRQQGTVSVEEERTIVGYFGTLNTINGTYGACVKVAHANTTVGAFTACANTLNRSMSDPAMLAALHITNAKAQGELQGVSQAITTLITTTLTALGGK